MTTTETNQIEDTNIQAGLAALFEGLTDLKDRAEDYDGEVEVYADACEEMLIHFGESGIASVSTFEDAGLMTTDRGVVVELADGSEFQITIVRSK